MQPLLWVLMMITSIMLLYQHHLKIYHTEYVRQLIVQQRCAQEEYLNYEAARVKTRKVCQKKSIEKTKSTSDQNIHKRYKTKKKLKYSLEVPPYNARLNLWLLFGPSDRVWQEHLYHLCVRLYPHIDQLVIQRLVTTLATYSEIAEFKYPDELSSLELQDPLLQKTLLEMLQGNLGQGIPSLLYFLSSSKEVTKERINVMFVPYELLAVIVNDDVVALEILKVRDALWKKIQDQNTALKEQRVSRKELKDELHTAIAHILSTHLLPEHMLRLFDYSLGTPGNILMLQDPATGMWLRKKINEG